MNTPTRVPNLAADPARRALYRDSGTTGNVPPECCWAPTRARAPVRHGGEEVPYRAAGGGVYPPAHSAEELLVSAGFGGRDGFEAALRAAIAGGLRDTLAHGGDRSGGATTASGS